MKKLFLASILALTTAFASAQEGFQGRWFLGGSIGYDHDKSGASGVKSDEFSVLPTVGYFIAPTIAIGGQVGYNYEKVGVVKSNAVIIAPLARKYWGIGDKFYFFGQLDAPVEFGNTKVGSGSKSDYISWGINFRPGFDYFFTNHWSMETTIGRFGYGTYNPDGTKHNDDSSFGINLNNINFGFKYVF